jgi:hypothetical protein
METYEHKELIKENRLEKSLSQGLMKKIELFDKMHARLDTVTGSDKTVLTKKLTALDEELTEDLEEQFEDQIQHNDLSLTNEDILEIFYHRKKDVLLSELRNVGFTGHVEAHYGNYWLERISSLVYKYRVRMKKN